MITVTRINGSRLVVNAELIRYIESIPDTVITLTTDDRIMVKESTDEIVRKMRRIRPPPPPADRTGLTKSRPTKSSDSPNAFFHIENATGRLWLG